MKIGDSYLPLCDHVLVESRSRFSPCESGLLLGSAGCVVCCHWSLLRFKEWQVSIRLKRLSKQLKQLSVQAPFALRLFVRAIRLIKVGFRVHTHGSAAGCLHRDWLGIGPSVRTYMGDNQLQLSRLLNSVVRKVLSIM
jgi:hypothetical protein